MFSGFEDQKTWTLDTPHQKSEWLEPEHDNLHKEPPLHRSVEIFHGKTWVLYPDVVWNIFGDAALSPAGRHGKCEWCGGAEKLAKSWEIGPMFRSESQIHVGKCKQL